MIEDIIVWEVIGLSFALSMDAMAIAIGLGVGLKKRSELYKMALAAAVYFGVAQFLMAFIGFVLGDWMLGWLADAAPWIAMVVLVAVGVHMLWAGINSKPNQDQDQNQKKPQPSTTQRADIGVAIMLPLAVAGSIDALAAGFSLNVLAVNGYVSAVLIGLVTAFMSLLGVGVGYFSGHWLENKAEIMGGLVLIGIGLLMVF